MERRVVRLVAELDGVIEAWETMQDEDGPDAGATRHPSVICVGGCMTDGRLAAIWMYVCDCMVLIPPLAICVAFVQDRGRGCEAARAGEDR